MANLGKCPDCPPGTKDRILIAGKCPFHYANPVGKKKAADPEDKALATAKKPAKAKSSKKAPAKGKKKRKRIPARSAKKIEEDLIYAVRRPIFLANNPICQINKPGCWKVSKQVHHKNGRGVKYLDESTWLASCDGPCHTEITTKSKKAIEDGHSNRRNQPIRRSGPDIFQRKRPSDDADPVDAGSPDPGSEDLRRTEPSDN